VNKLSGRSDVTMHIGRTSLVAIAVAVTTLLVSCGGSVTPSNNSTPAPVTNPSSDSATGF